MAALTADRKRVVEGTPTGIKWGVAASTTIYAGALVAIDADGYAIPGDDVAGLQFVGVALSTVDNSGGADGDKEVVCQVGHIERGLNATGLAQTQVGTFVFISDDNTVTDATAATNDVKVGTLIAYPATDKADVLIGIDISGVTSG